MAIPPNITPPTGAWTTVKDLVKDTIGPMGALGIAASAFVKATAGAALNAEKLRRALEASSGAERLRSQFVALGLSAEQAKVKVEGLAKVASSSAFSFEALGQASKNLLSVGGAAADSAAMLKRVQDVAAATGAPLDAVATAMGVLYNQASRDGDLSGAAQNLANFGAISESTAAKVQQLAAAGAPAADSLRAIEADLSKAKGAGAELASSLVGLQAQLANLEQANNINIGNLFIEGEKAGLRAAQSFEKIRAAIDETASAPFAAIFAGINKIKEVIGEGLSTDGALKNIKGLFTFLAAAAVATLGVIIVQTALFAATLLKAAAAALVKAGALRAMTAAGGKWLSWINTAAGRANIYAAALALVAVKAYETVEAINASAKAVQDLSKANAKQMGGAVKSSLTAVTPEQKKEAVDSLDAQIQENDERLKKAQEERGNIRAGAQAEGFSNWQNYVPFMGYFDQVGANAEREAKDNEIGLIEAQGSQLRKVRDNLIKRQAVGLTADQEKQEIGRKEIEESTRKDAINRMQAAGGAKYASRIAEDQLKEAKVKSAQTAQDSKVSFAERSALNDAQIKMIGAREDPKKFQEALSGITGLSPTSEVGKLSKDVAMRETLLSEYAQANADAMEGRKGGGERATLLKGKIAELYGGGNFAAGLAELQGEGTQKAKIARDEAIKKGDPNAALLDEKAKEDMARQAREALAAENAANDASRKKLSIQKQLNALGGVEGGDAKAAELEGNQQVDSLNKRIEATRKLELAQGEFRNAQSGGNQEKIKQAQAKVDEARQGVFAAGGDANTDSLDSLDQELEGVRQVMEMRKQAAAIEQASANARRNEIMQELRLRQQIAQLAFNNATGTTGKKGGKSEVDMRINDEKKTRQKAEEAKALVAEREALRASGASPDAEQELNRRIAALGFDKNTNSQDINAAIKQSQLNEADLRTQQVEANRNIKRDAEIQSLSAQEKYAPNQEARKTAKEKREKLEDEAAIEEKTAQYSKTMDQGKARDVATKETELQRLMTRADEAGTPRVDSLTAVGGGATGFIGSNPVDIQKDIRKKTDELAGLLKTVGGSLEKQIDQGREILQQIKDDTGS